MIVYMLLNTVEERCYVGQTEDTLEQRLARHWDAVNDGSDSLLHEAMRRWDAPHFWEAVVLHVCSSAEVLDAMEAHWIQECSSHLSGVGYNAVAGRERSRRPVQREMSEERRAFFRECGRRGGEVAKRSRPPKPKRPSPLEGMTPEQRREYFRECGRRGAAKSRGT